MSQQVRTCLVGLVLLAFSATSFAQDVHILLRAKDGKTWFHLGEPITLEAACLDSATGHYLLPCTVVLKAEGVSPGSRMLADRIDQTAWEDAQTGALPPGPRGQCGNVDNRLPSEVSDAPTWSEVTLKEPFPAYVGQYKITADLAFDLEMAERFGQTQKHASSNEVEISVDDNLGWKNHLIHFHDCDYDFQLALVPDEEAVGALRKHLNECARTFDEPYTELLHEIVWLKMQVEQPELYSRMLELERTRLPFRRDEEADLQMQELEQARTSAAGDVKQIHNWFHDQYRELLLETGKQLVQAYKSHPELHHNQDFQEDLQSGFESWHDAAACLFGGADSYVSREEVVMFLKEAGRSQKDIAAFLENHKSNLPLATPEYQH